MAAVQSIHLLWHREIDGVLGLPKHAVADNGTVAVAVRNDPHLPTIELFDYELHRLANGHARPDAEPAGSFTMDGIRRLEFAPQGQLAAVITDKDFFLVRINQTGPVQFPYMPGRGLVFLDTAVAGADPRKTIAFLLQDRSSASFTLTVAEGREKLAPIWARSWKDPLSAISVSADGNFLAVGHANGEISLLDRGRKLCWEYANPIARPTASLSVDYLGNVVVVDIAGEVRRHEPVEGAVIWRNQIVPHDLDSRMPGARISYRVTTDDRTQIAGIAMAVISQRQNEGLPDSSRYFLLDAASGTAVWEDALHARPTGIAISPSGEFMAISTPNALQFFSMRLYEKQAQSSPAPAIRPGLIEKAKNEANEGHYFAALPHLTEALEADPTNIEAAALHEEVCWQIRESVMELTTQTTRESLAMVEAALVLLPHNERLTMRRNALARILATKRHEEGDSYFSAGRYEDAIMAYRDAISLDIGSIEARRSILRAEERVLRGILQKAQTAIAETRWYEALNLLEEARAIRPDNPDISAMIASIQRDEAYAEGLRYYTAQRYSEAAFQFKRTLMLDPGHMEAVRHLNMAETQLRKSPEDEKEQPAPATKPYRAQR